MAKLLVVGKSGQLARAIAGACASSGVDAICLERPDLDLTKPETIERAISRVAPQVILNTAAFTDVDGAESEQETAFDINARGPEHLANICARYGLPLIHISTDYVFDGQSSRPYRPDDPVAPLSVYGQSKAAGEVAVRETLETHVIIRTAWLYSMQGRNFLRTMLRLGEEKDQLSIVDDQTGSPTYAHDLAAGLLTVARMLLDRQEPSHWGTFHMTNAGSTTWFGFAEAIFETAASNGQRAPDLAPIPTRDYPMPAKRPAFSVLDCQLTEDTFGVRMRPWKEALSACLEAHYADRSLMAERF